jgi:hypothetical protein
MKRITLLVASVLALVGVSNLAHAKPSVAVLGLEVIDNGSVDKKATQAAQALAVELRSQAGRSNGKYGLAPNSAKDLLELKLLSGCGNEGRACMAAIGKELKADRLLYGKLELKKTGYQVSLNLLDTNTRQMEKTTSELIPVSDLHSSKITRWSRTLYNRLIGLPESGTLRIDANVDKATIYVDGSVSTTLRDGSAKVVGLEEGVHQVAIEADGYKRYESDVSILAGETETLSLSLSKTKSTGGGIGDEKDPNDIWKYSFYAGAVTTVGAGGLWFYYGKQAGYIGGSSLIDAKNDTWRELQEAGEMGVDGNPEQAAVNQISDGAGGGVINGSCDKASDSALPSSTRLDAFRVACKDGDDAASRATYLAYGTGVFALATAYLGYRAYLANGSNKEKQYGKKKSKKKSRVVVVPQLGPKGIGAGLSVEF